MPRMSKCLDGPAPTISVKLRDADAHQLAALAFLELLLSELGVADLVHRLLQRPGVVAAVVFPAKHRLVGELVRGDEVLETELGRIHAELLRHDVDHPLDRVRRLGHPERAAIGDAARRLVRVGAVHLGERVLEVVGAGADREQPGRELRRIRRGVGIAVIGDRLDPQGGQRPVLLARELGLHVVVAREGVGLQVLHPIFNPLHRLADDHRRGDGNDVAGVDRDFAAEAAADVGRHDANLLLGEPDVSGHQRHHRSNRVRRLRRHVDGELAGDAIEVGDAAAGFNRRDVNAREVDVLGDRRPRRSRTPSPSPAGRRPPSGRCDCPSCPSCRFAAPARPAPAP